MQDLRTLVFHTQMTLTNNWFMLLEGPEHSVYVRGQLKNKNIIVLPEVWRNLVDERSISVSLTPVGTHQELFVKGTQDNKIIVGSKAGLPVNCHYHVFEKEKILRS